LGTGAAKGQPHDFGKGRQLGDAFGAGSREIAPGTLRSLIRASGLTVEAFVALTKK
jgi:hypothetical protein